jgi:N-acetyl-gamma-glutamyl-phosphate reductase
VQVLPKGEIPHTRHVRGSNYVLIGVFEDRLPGRAIVICVIDNLVKVGSITRVLLIMACH